MHRRADDFAHRVALAEIDASLRVPATQMGTGRFVAWCPDCGAMLDVTPRQATHEYPACPAWAAYVENWQPRGIQPFELHVPAIALSGK